MTCCNCGGDIIGDGYTYVRHCEYADVPDYIEADASTVLCKLIEDNEDNEATYKPSIDIPADHLEGILSFSSIVTILEESYCANWPYFWPGWLGGNEDFVGNNDQDFWELEDLRFATMNEF